MSKLLENNAKIIKLSKINSINEHLKKLNDEQLDMVECLVKNLAK